MLHCTCFINCFINVGRLLGDMVSVVSFKDENSGLLRSCMSWAYVFCGNKLEVCHIHVQIQRMGVVPTQRTIATLSIATGRVCVLC
mmetsp:Transcript_29417/g.55070  ORF Transcript_29417/g.55070 Transcript_29417/m.55070 type:complete len:86 (+) Transcript_29417:792-1049(+)